jgi:hypothetical protein
VNENRAFASAVRLFPVLGDVHADSLLFLARAKRRDQRYRFQDHERSHRAIDNGGDDCNELDAKLSRIAEQRAIGCPVPDFLRQYSGEQCSHCSADPMRRNHVERVIEPGARSPKNGEIARNGGDCAKRNSRYWTHKTRGGGDRY